VVPFAPQIAVLVYCRLSTLYGIGFDDSIKLLKMRRVGETLRGPVPGGGDAASNRASW